MKFCTLIAFLLSLMMAQGLYIYVDYSTPKCLVQQIDAFIPIVLYYKNSDFYMYNDIPESGDISNYDNVHMTVYDPDKSAVFEGNAKESGKFIFTPFKKGNYKICIQINHGKGNDENMVPGGGEFRFYFDIKNGLIQTNTTTIAKTSNLIEAKKAISQLTQAIHDMKTELEYQNDEEQKVRDEDDDTNHKIIIWTCLEAFMLIVVALWQVYSIRSYLIKTHTF